MSKSVLYSCPEVDLESLELSVDDLKQAERLFTTSFDFDVSEINCDHDDEDVVRLHCGAVEMALRSGFSNAGYVASPGNIIANVALMANDAPGLLERASAYGLKVSYSGTRRGVVDILGDGKIIHSIVNRNADGVRPARPRAGRLEIQAVDHVAYCIPYGSMDSVVSAYQRVFGLRRLEVRGSEYIGNRESGMRSIVLRSVSGFTIVLTEPLSPTSVGQTQRFLETHRGAGVQHVAFACDDLIRAARSLVSRGVSLLPISVRQLELSYRRLSDYPLAWDLLRRYQILVDADESGMLFQIFTRPIMDRSSFFFEFIQRDGAIGFGENNIRALFEAVDSTIKNRSRRPAVLSAHPKP